MKLAELYNAVINQKEIINMIASIGTFISALIAIFTLNEIKKQRLSAYKPFLVLKSFIVYINKSPLCLNQEELLLFKTDNFNEYQLDDKPQKTFEITPLYKIENLGFGIAKNIKLTWTFDMKIALKCLESEFNQDLFFGEYKPLKYYFLHKKSDQDYQYSFINENITKQTIDYIPPINVKEHTHFHAISKDLIVTHFLYYILKNKLTEELNKNPYTFNFDDFPKVELKIKYYDLNNKKYQHRYKFKMSFISTQSEEFTDVTKEFGYLHFELV